MPNGIDLGPTVFTQWREQQGGAGGGILRLLDIGKTLTFSVIFQNRYVLAKN